MKIKILHLIEGAKQAEGLTVIIDVFRAFSLECYLYAQGAEEIVPVGNIERAYEYKREDETCILAGERHGKKCEGFDFGNSPSAFRGIRLDGRKVIHTTSAGTQGVANAKRADEIITGSLVNAKAVAEYIRRKNPDVVSLVCMGMEGTRLAEEDELCAQYIKSILEDQELEDIQARAEALKDGGGKHFFQPDNQEIYPEEDFWMCIQCNRFPFVIRIFQSEGAMASEKLSIEGL
ncbi:2-phosphosulfolactate phosphatase [Lachnospiraceae bacterium 62-35]